MDDGDVLGKRQILFILALSLLVTVPFLNKAVHVDDTFVLHISQNILNNPFDPFAGDFDWFGHLATVWEQTTNPPFISYWLAPFLAMGNGSEWVLHLAFIPFYLMLGIGMFRLGLRFTDHQWIPLLLLILSPAIIVSGNLMRDIPAMALGTLGLSLSIQGADERRTRLGLWGVFLIGLAAVTKYSAAVLLVPFAFYLIWSHRSRFLLWLTVPLGIISSWCLFSWIVYGQPHPVYLLLERTSDPGIYWPDKLLSAFTVLGSSVYLIPLLLFFAVYNRYWRLIVFSLVLCAVIWLGSAGYYGGNTDWQFLFWTLPGGILFLIANWTGLKRIGSNPDVLFLMLWLWCPFLFSIIFVPFQAVRHLLPALPALIILLLQFIKQAEGKAECQKQRQRFIPGFVAVITLQACMAFTVHIADYEYASTYRNFVENSEQWSSNQPGIDVWYAGHWGWMFYANRAGIQQLHRDGPYPAEGDLLIWPEKVHVGDAFSVNQQLRSNLELVKSLKYKGAVPFRTLSMEARAGFYATIKRRIPYRFDQTTKLEVFRVYRVVGVSADR